MVCTIAGRISYGRRLSLGMRPLKINKSSKDIVVKFLGTAIPTHNYDFVMNCVAENYIDNSPTANTFRIDC